MADFTQNYGLHQWEPTDPFLREDFNQDFSTIDTALGRAERSAEANAYNVYNLMLQNYYEGKYTGYKKALLFDGFLDKSGIAEKSECLICSNGTVYLERAGQENITISYTSEYASIHYDMYFPEQTAASSGYLTGWSVRTEHLTGGNPQAFTCQIDCMVSINGKPAFEGQIPLLCTLEGSNQTMSLPDPVEVGTGDVLSICLNSHDSEVRLSVNSEVKICGILHFTPASGIEGSLVSHNTALPIRNRILAWVRHNGGTTAVTILDGDQEYPMVFTGIEETENLQGKSCKESAFALDDVPGGAALAVRLELTLSDGENAASLYDYGVTVL